MKPTIVIKIFHSQENNQSSVGANWLQNKENKNVFRPILSVSRKHIFHQKEKMDKLVPFQNLKELDSMIKNATRDLKALKDFILKEKNAVIQVRLEKILIASWQLARRYDGCDKSVMETPEFRKECHEVFVLIAAQKRGGRKLFMNTTSSPISGLNQVHFTWWSTVRGYQGSTLRFMDNFMKQLAPSTQESFSDSAISAGTSSNESLDISNPSWIKQRLLKDVEKIIQEKMDEIGDMEGFGVGSSFNDDDNREFLLTITLIPKDNDVGDSDVDDNKKGNNNKNPVQKKEPIVSHIVPKSESSRCAPTASAETAAGLPKPAKVVPMEVDSDGFWTKYDRDLPISAEETWSQGYKILKINNFNKIMSKLKYIDRIQRFIETGEVLVPMEQPDTAATDKGMH